MVDRQERVVLSATDSGFSTTMAKAAGEVALLRRELAGLDGTSVDLGDGIRRTTTDVDNLGTSTRRSGADLDSFTGRLGLLAQAAGTLGPALAPLGAVAVGGALALTNQLGFAAAAAGVAIGAFQGVGDALKAVDEAALKPTAENLAKAREAMEQLSPAARDMVRELNGLQPILTDLRDAGAEGLFPGLIEGMDQLATLAPQVERIVTNIASAMGDLFAEGAASLAGPRWANFFDMLEQEARPTLESLAHSIGSIAHGLGQLWTAFMPLNNTFNGWIEDAARGFDDWATGLAQAPAGLHEFVDYIRENGPTVAHAIGAIASAILQIAEAAAPLGGPVLKGITLLADAIAALADSPLGAPIMTWVTAASALSLAAKAAAGSVKLLGLEAGTAGAAMGGLTGIGVIVGLQQVASNLDKVKDSMSGLREDVESGTFNGQHGLDFFSGLANQVPIVGGLFDAASKDVFKFGSELGILPKLKIDRFLSDTIAGTTDAGSAAAKAMTEVATHTEALRLKLKQARIEAHEEAAAIREAAQGFYTLADAVEKPTLSLADLETRMARQAEATRNMAKNMQTAIENGVNPRALKKMFDELGTDGALAMEQLANGGKKAARQFNASFRDSEGAAHSLEDVLGHLAKAIDRLAGMRAKPKLDLDDAAFTSGVKKAGAAITGLDKREARPHVGLDGIGEAIAGARSLQSAISALHDKTVHVTTVYSHMGSPGGAGTGSDAGLATGGYTGPGGKYEPAGTVHRGEVVLPQEVVARDAAFLRNRYGYLPNMDNLPGYAPGGFVTGRGMPTSPADPFALFRRAADESAQILYETAATWGHTAGELFLELHEGTITQRDLRLIELSDRKRFLNELLKEQEKEIESLRKRIDVEKQLRDSIRDSVAGIISAGHDLLGATGKWMLPDPEWVVDPTTGVGSMQIMGDASFESQPATFNSFQSALTAQYGTASELSQILKTLKAKGFTGQTLSWLIQNGATIQTLRDFAAQDAAALAGVQAQFSQVQNLTHQVGNQASGALGVNDAIARKLDKLNDVRDAIHTSNQALKGLDQRLERLERKADQEVNATKDVESAVRGQHRQTADGQRRRN